MQKVTNFTTIETMNVRPCSVLFAECTGCGEYTSVDPYSFDDIYDSAVCERCAAESDAIDDDYDWGLNPLGL